MPVKEQKLVEVKHILASGTPENLNEVLSNFLNNGWDEKKTQFISYEDSSRTMKVFYLLVRDV